MQEKQLEAKFRQAVKKIGGWAMKFTSPGLAGVPDRLVLLQNGVICFVELKCPGGQPRPLQVYVIKKIRSLGVQVHIIDSEQAIRNFITHYERGYQK